MAFEDDEVHRGLLTTPISKACKRWGKVTNLEGHISSFCIFNDALSTSQLLTLHEQGEGTVQGEDTTWGEGTFQGEGTVWGEGIVQGEGTIWGVGTVQGRDIVQGEILFRASLFTANPCPPSKTDT